MEDEYTFDVFWHSLNYRTASSNNANDAWLELDACIQRKIDAAIAIERERCAGICDGLADVCEASANGVRRGAGVNTAKSCAMVIRMK